MKTKNQLCNLYLIAEEAAYSAKGHFKSADWIKLIINMLIAVPLVTSLLTFGFNLGQLITQIVSFIGLLFSFIALLYTNEHVILNSKIIDHMELGNSYLELYKAIRTVCFEPSCITKEEVLNFQTKISELDKKSTT